MYYLPIYLQAVKGTDATESGVRTISLILASSEYSWAVPMVNIDTERCLALVGIVSGASIGALKLFNPFIITGGVLSTVASGLLMTLQADSNHALWIGYQVLAGVGLGLCFNVYIIIIQNIVKPDEVATASAILLCKFLSCLLPSFSFHHIS